jgi:hypothetical protein
MAWLTPFDSAIVDDKTKAKIADLIAEWNSTKDFQILFMGGQHVPECGTEFYKKKRGSKMAKIKELIKRDDLEMWTASAKRGEEDGIMVMAGLELEENDPNLMDYPPFIAKFALNRPEKTGGEDIGLWVNSGLARKSEKEFPATPEQKRLLAFGCVLLAKNLESCRTLHIRDDEDRVGEMLSNFWDVEDAEGASEVAESLSEGGIHTEFADEFYNLLVKTGKTEVSAEDVFGYVKEFSLRRTVARGLRSISSDLGVGIFHDNFVPSLTFIGALAEVIMNGHVFGKSNLPEVFEDEDKQQFTAAVDKFAPQFNGLLYGKLAEKINEILGVCQKAREFLVRQGYTDEELADINTIAAWDYGRTAIIARYGVRMGFMEEAQAWQLLQTAADNAEKLYGNWREYFAAYIFGRAIAFGQPSNDYGDVAEYLLGDEMSPFSECSFKSGGAAAAPVARAAENESGGMKNITATELPKYQDAQYLSLGNGIFRDLNEKYRYVATLRFELQNADDLQSVFEAVLSKYSVKCTEHFVKTENADGTICVEAEIESNGNEAFKTLNTIKRITNLVGKQAYNMEAEGGVMLVIADKCGRLTKIEDEMKADAHEAGLWAMLGQAFPGGIDFGGGEDDDEDYDDDDDEEYEDE